MKGEVLGYDGLSGAISGEDGARYSFIGADWKSPQPPKPRDMVDFVAEGSRAGDIYVTRTGFAMGTGSDPLNADAAIRARAMIATRPQVAIEAVLVLASLIFNFMGAPTSGGAGGVSLVGVGPAMGQIRAAMAAAASIAAAFSGHHGGAPAGLTLLTLLGYALWLIPLAAGYLLYLEYRSRRSLRLEFAVGVAAAASFLYILLAKAVISAMMGGLGAPFGDVAAATIGFGFGALVVLLCGVGLIMTARGRLTRTPGL